MEMVSKKRIRRLEIRDFTFEMRLSHKKMPLTKGENLLLMAFQYSRSE